MVILVNITNQNNHISFIPHAFSKNIYPFGHMDNVIKLNLLKSHDL
jgi:hypothetical protein